MADIELSVGLQKGSLNTSQIKAELEGILNSLNGSKSTKIDIKPTISSSSAQEVKQQLDKVLSTGTKAFESRLTKITLLQDRAQLALKNMSAAKYDINTEKSYNNIVNLSNGIATLKSGLMSGKMSAEEFDVSFAKLSRTLQTSQNSIKLGGLNFKSFGDVLSSVSGEMLRYFSAAKIASDVIRITKQSVKSAIELQDSLVELEIVTGASGSQFDKYASSVTNLAKELGVASKDISAAVTTFARLGYSFDESNVLAKYTGMLEKVGGIDASNAQEAVTAILKAFPEDASVSNIESVMDKLVTVGNNFPISVSQLAEGMNNASSALAAAGNTFDQSVALLTAANVTIQNSSKSSTGLRTIAARLRNTTADLEELGETDFTTAKYQDLVNALTEYKVSLLDINGQYRSTYDIMSDIASVWDQLDSKQRAALATAIAGTRQQAVFYSLIDNFQSSAAESLESMSTSGGTLEKAYAVYLDSITAHAAQFKAAFDGMSLSILSPLTSIVNAIIDIGTAILNVVSLITSGLAPAISFVSGILGQVIGFGVNIINWVVDVAKKFPAATTAVVALGAAFTALTRIGASGSVLSWLAGGQLAAITAGIAAIAAIAIPAINAIKEYNYEHSIEGISDSIADTESQIKDLNKAMEDNIDRMNEINAIKGTSAWSIQLDAELKSLELENGLLKEQKEFQEAILANSKAAKREAVKSKILSEYGGSYTSRDIYDDIPDVLRVAIKYREAIDADTDKYLINELGQDLNERVQELINFRGELDLEQDAYYIGLIDSLLSNIYDVALFEAPKAAEALETSVPKVAEDLNTIVERAKGNLSDLSSAMTEAFSSTGMTADSVSKIKAMFESVEGFDASALFEMTGAGIKMNTDELTKLTAQYVELEKMNLLDTIDTTSEKIKNVDEQLKNLDETAENYTEQKEKLESQRDTFENDIIGAKAAFVEIMALTNAYNEYIAAKSRAQNTDKLSTIKADYDTIADYFARGFGNSAVVREYLEMFFGNGNVQDTQAAWDQLNQTIAATGHTLMDYMTMDENGKLTSSGLDMFVEDLWALQQAGAFGDENIISQIADGQYHIEMTAGKIEAVANAFGTSTEFVRNFLEAMQDVTGSDFHLEEIFGELGDKSANAGEESNPLKETAEYMLKIENGAHGTVTVVLAPGSMDDLNSVIEKLDKINLGAEATVNDDGSISKTASNAAGLIEILGMVDPETKVIITDENTGEAVEVSVGEVIAAAERLTNTDANVDIDSNADDVAGDVSEVGSEAWLLNYLKTKLNIDDNTSDVSGNISDLKTNAENLNTEHQIPFIANVAEVKGQFGEIDEAAKAVADKDREIKYRVTFSDGSEGEYDEEGFKDLTNQAALSEAVSAAVEAAVADVENGLQENPYLTPAMAALFAQHEVEQGWDYGADFTGKYLNPESTEVPTDVTLVPGDVDNSEVKDAIEESVSEAADEASGDEVEVEENVSVSFQIDKDGFSKSGEMVRELTEGQTEDAVYEVNIDGAEEGEQDLDALSNKISSLPGVTSCEVDDSGTVLRITGEVGALNAALLALPTNKTITISIVKNGSLPSITPHASGTRNAPGGLSLVNEEGPEIISDNGVAYVANGGKPALVNLSKGAIVLNADETQDALSGNGLSRPVNAYASGKVDLWGTITSAYNTAKNFVVNALTNMAGGSGNYTTSSGNKKSSGSGGSGGGSGGGSSNDKKEDDSTQKIDWIEVAIDRIERAIDSLADTVASSFKLLATRLKAADDEISKIQEEITTAQQGAERYLKEAESVSLSAALKERARNGTIDINEYDKDTADKINEYLKWYEKGLDLQEKVAELHENIAEIYQDRFNMVQDDYEDQLDQLEHQIAMQEKNVDLASEMGYLESESFYEAMSQIESRRLTTLNAELADLERYLSEALDSGEIAEGSEAWYEMSQNINEVKESIADSNIELVKYQKTLRSIGWDRFAFAMDRFGQLSDEANFLVDLMSNGELYDDRGQFNGAGLATLGMRSLNYNAYMQTADEYAKELEKVSQLIKEDPYDTELIKKREELLSLQRDAISAAEDEKIAVQSLVSEGIEKELDALKELVDEYKESLDSAKDLYDYQNKLSEKSADIASLQKQIAAYAGDTSEENRSRLQKLQKELADSQKDLRETEYERSISDQKELLDDLYEEYEELLNARLDDVNKLMQDMIDMTNENMSEIRDKIDEVTAAVGYGITESMTTALDGTFSYYDGVFTEITSITKVLDNIYNMVGAMAQASGAVRAYSSGGLVDYTGLAMLHGSPSAPELVLNKDDTARFLQMISAMHTMYDGGDTSSRGIALKDTAGAYYGANIGNINLDIMIDHVMDYNDFVTQLRDDPKFERIVQAMTIEPALGKSRFSKNRINI